MAHAFILFLNECVIENYNFPPCRVLQRTSISTNIKERLDFSCALFGPDGGLVANAPHIPVHLGAMQETGDNRHNNIAAITFDYISRLPEFYYFRAIN